MAQESSVDRVLDLSCRVSARSAPMKPFVRFAPEMQQLYGGDRRPTRWHYWDFDVMAQKVLLSIVHATITPEELAAACADRWAVNLARLERDSRQKLEEAVKLREKVVPRGYARVENIVDRMRPKARFLYAGCGAGGECLALAHRGLEVVGIDSVPGLVDVANAWAGHLGLAFRAYHLDAMALDSRFGRFDGFLVEFYGDLPRPSQTLRLRQNLHDVLADDGRGFVMGVRRKYASYWYLMGTDYPPLMTARLAAQSVFDYRFLQPDKCEEQLSFGLYTRTHTRESLAAELGRTFSVVECDYESDPRYVVGVVGRRQGPPAEPGPPEGRDAAGLNAGAADAAGLLDKVEAVCDMLEAHEKKVRDFYDRSEESGRTNLLEGVVVDYAGFIRLLERLSRVLPADED